MAPLSRLASARLSSPLSGGGGGTLTLASEDWGGPRRLHVCKDCRVLLQVLRSSSPPGFTFLIKARALCRLGGPAVRAVCFS